MDDLIEQLRHLGDTTESSVPAVSASEARSRTDSSLGIDIGRPRDSVPGTDSVKGRSRAVRTAGTGRNDTGRSSLRRMSAKLVVAAAAAVLVMLAGSIALIRSDRSDRPFELAGAMQPDDRFAVPDDNGWAELRQCESSGDYTTDTGNTFYGAYQFTRSMWRDTALSLGLGDYVVTNPADAPPHVQDAIANALYLDRGTDPWPICGRYIEGPMVTPVVPQWLGQQRDEQRDEQRITIVFNNPDVNDAQIAEINAAVEAIVTPDEAGSREIVFIDKDAAFAEFQAMFRHDERARESVQASAMPTSFRISALLSPEQLGQLRDIPGVFEVVQNLDFIESPTSAPLRLSVPTIGLETPIYSTPSIGHLSMGAAVVVSDTTALVAGGHGAIDGSVFDRLDELRSGDTITVTWLVGQGATMVEVSRSFAVSGGADVPSTEDVDGVLTLWRGTNEQRLTLVADVAGSPTQRLIVRAEIIGPDLSLYPIDAE